jgi:hypothetical protein
MCNLSGKPSQQLFWMWLLKLPIKYDLEENIFWFMKLVKVSKGTQYSAESAPTLVPALVRASPALLSMWPSKHISHIQVLVTYFCFPTPPIRLKLGLQIGGRLQRATSVVRIFTRRQTNKRLWTANRETFWQKWVHLSNPCPWLHRL